MMLMISLTSCKKGFIEANTDPNTSEFALPEALLAPALTKVVSYNMSRAQRVGNELMQVTVAMGDTEGKIFRYEIRVSEADYLWNNWYLQLTNFKDIYESATSSTARNFAYQGIALISEVWVYSMLTDTYGDIPYFDALKGKEGILMPKFDNQKDIYLDLFRKLEEANDILMQNAALSTKYSVQSGSDPIYGGDLVKWRKFGNSLYLRLLLRLSEKAEVADVVIPKIKEIVDTKASTYPIIASNAESAVLKWTGVAPYVSPFSTWRDADWYSPKMASFFIDNLVDWGDPRIAKWATLSLGEYVGVPSGYAPGDNPPARSTPPTSLKSEALLGNILNYSEVQFMLAELATRELITSKTAKNSYEAGITNGITYWGYAVPTDYLITSSAAWDEDLDFDSKMEMIFLQKYYSLYYTDLQSWFEYRRTKYPKMPKGLGLKNGGEMPARLNYPVYVQAANGANYMNVVARQGADNISTLVWWQKP